MIKVTVYKNQEHQYVGFRCIGHSGYARIGSDIVCAGVSALVLNAVNSIEMFTDDLFCLNTDPKLGLISMKLRHPAGKKTALLLDSMILGLHGIQRDYGKRYMILDFKEV